MSQPYDSLKPSQKRTLNAWKIALEDVNFEHFSEALKEKIEDIEKELSQNNYQVINEILEIVKENTDLNDAYQTARKALAEDYNSQERDKIAISYNSNNLTPITSNSRTKTKQKINRKALLILQALETYPLTLEDLKYRLNLPSSQVHKLVKQLWNERKINTLSGNSLYNLLPIIQRGELNIESDDSDTYFTLTSLGTLQLRTLVNSR